jgi:hypothetical protein
MKIEELTALLKEVTADVKQQGFIYMYEAEKTKTIIQLIKAEINRINGTIKPDEMLPCCVCKNTDTYDITAYLVDKTERPVSLKLHVNNCPNCGRPVNSWKANGWIDVSDRLPDTDSRVLVTAQTKKGQRNINLAYVDERGLWHGSGSMAGVTAWQPLPEPYEGNDTNKQG